MTIFGKLKYKICQRKLLKKIGYLGKNAVVSPRSEIIAPERIHIGEGSAIAEECLINAIGGIFIGNYSGIGARSIVISTEHRHAGADYLPFDDVRMIKPVHIEDFVWIGLNVSILPGVRIGEGAIIGLGSVVTTDVPPLAIVMGNPAKIVGYRKKEHFIQLKEQKKFRPTSKKATLLWYPAFTKRKHGDIVDMFGFGDIKVNDIFEDPFHKNR